MTTDKGRKKRRVPEPRPGNASADPARPVSAPGPRQPSDRTWLLRPKKAETDPRIRRRQAHIDDLIRVVRNLAALVVLCSAFSTLVAYAGIRMGVAPEICWLGTVSGGPVLVRTFIKLFETVRPSLPAAPEDPPSTDER
jgi:hypothetical protein